LSAYQRPFLPDSAPAHHYSPAIAASAESATSLDTVWSSPAAVADAPWSVYPGSAGERAESWAVRQERASADLSFDFVPPELIIAAQVYGFGPAEAAQAARLAVSGRTGLAALAGAVDMRFVDALRATGTDGGPVSSAADVDVSMSYVAPQTFAPGAVGDIPTDSISAAEAYAPPIGAPAIQPVATPAASARTAATPPGPSAGHPTAFGLPLRTPRGAFLWPASAARALNLDISGADTTTPFSLAALDLLAANAVADVGVYAVPDFQGDVGSTDGGQRVDTGAVRPSPVTGATTVGAEPASAEAASGEHVEIARAFAASAELPVEFEQIYVSLSQSPAGRSMSPTVRAARALAIARRSVSGDASPARTRAAAAWAVMPHVMVGDATSTPEMRPLELPGGEAASPFSFSGQADFVPSYTSGGAPAAQRYAGDEPYADVGPLHLVSSSHAGEALREYVAPAESAPASPTPKGAVLRAPTAQPPLVETGMTAEQQRDNADQIAAKVARARAQGKVELPSWFEAAARKMAGERSSADDGISLAELTLISGAPARHVAASPRSEASGGGAAPTDAPSGSQDKATPDVEKIARDVYEEIMRMVEIARERNGEPYV
jgi:hypothetical protein